MRCARGPGMDHGVHTRTCVKAGISKLTGRKASEHHQRRLSELRKEKPTERKNGRCNPKRAHRAKQLRPQPAGGQTTRSQMPSPASRAEGGAWQPLLTCAATVQSKPPSSFARVLTLASVLVSPLLPRPYRALVTTSKGTLETEFRLILPPCLIQQGSQFP